MRRRKKARSLPPARETITLKAPAGCGAFKRNGRRYVPTGAGLVTVPIELVDDLRAHGFAPAIDEAAVPTRDETLAESGRKHGRG
jgi:hypothetical protein